MNHQEEVHWQGKDLILLADKSIFWPSQKTLFIADPHFGKAATFRNAGIPVPERTTQEDCERLSRLIEETNSTTIIFLGDFFHARVGKTKVVKEILFQWRTALPNLKIHLIRGNHDLNSGDPWPELQIQCHSDPWPFSGVECRHLPVERSGNPYLAGHIHPGFSLKGKGKSSIRSPCFHLNDSKIILPAFGSFTGLQNVKPTPGDEVYLTNGIEIVKIQF